MISKQWPTSVVAIAFLLGIALTAVSVKVKRFLTVDSAPQLVVYGDANVRPSVACPAPGARTMVVLVVGQSHTANFVGERTSEGKGQFEAFRGKCYAGRDPVLGAGNAYGNLWTNIARRIVKDGVYDDVVLSFAAVSTVKVSVWEPGGIFQSGLEAATKLPEGLSFTHVVMAAGTTDRFEKTDPALFASSYRRLASFLRTKAPGAPVFLSLETGYCGSGDTASYDPEAPVDKALRALPNPAEGLFPGVDLDRLALAADRYDGCHLSGPAADRAAQEWVRIIAKQKTLSPS